MNRPHRFLAEMGGAFRAPNRSNGNHSPPMDGRTIAQDGTYYKVNARLYDPPAKTIPLLMAANGPRAMHLQAILRMGWI